MKLKSYFLLLFAALFAFASINIEAQFQKDIKARIAAGDPLYVVFRNFDKQMALVNVDTGGGVTVPAPEFMYFFPILHSKFRENVIYADFSDDNIKAWGDLSIFDVAVFPLGDYPLQASTPGGITVLSQINKMLAAGKRVMILGRSYVYNAFNSSSPLYNSGAEDLLSQCGIRDLGIMNTTNHRPFTIKGIEDDSVAKGYLVACNVKQGRNGLPLTDPFAYVDGVDVFKITDTSICKPAYWFTYHHTVDDSYVYGMKPTDTIVACRVYTPKSKMVLYSMGYESACPADWMQNWQVSLWFAVEWFTYDLPKPNPWLLFSVTPLEFDSVAINTSKIKDVTIKNNGKKTMTISDIFVANFNDDNVFELLTTPTAFQLAPKGEQKLQVKFTPKAERRYEDYLTVQSNADNGKEIDLDLVGYGGGKPLEGAKISVDPTLLDFGDVCIPNWDTLRLEIANTGTSLLIVDHIDWIDQAGKAFDFYDAMTFPINIDAGKKVSVLIKFFPAKVGTYKGKLQVRADNALNTKLIQVTLMGNCPDCSGTQISVSTNSLEFDTVSIPLIGTRSIVFTNAGDNVLNIKTLDIVDGVDSVFKIETPFTGDHPIYKLDHDWPVEISYTPKVKSKRSTARLHVTTDATNNKDFYIDLSGTSADSTVAVEDIQTENVFVGIYPLPVETNSNISLTLTGTFTRQVNIYLIDILGNKVAEVLNAQMSPGVYVVPGFSTTGISSGSYFLITNAGTKTIKTPVLIAK